MILDDRVFGYVASAAVGEARVAANAADITGSTTGTVRACIIVMNEVAIGCWRRAFAVAAEAAQAAGQVDQAAAFRESWDHVEQAMAAAPRALGLRGPFM